MSRMCYTVIRMYVYSDVIYEGQVYVTTLLHFL
jgi:hypothetical protein